MSRTYDKRCAECTWSVGSWATMMCSWPRACSLSGVIAVWWPCRAVRHTKQKLEISLTFSGFRAADICSQHLLQINQFIPYTAVWPGPLHHCWLWWSVERRWCDSSATDFPDCGDAPCEISDGHFDWTWGIRDKTMNIQNITITQPVCR